MSRTARTATAATVVLAPLTVMAADQLRMRAENANEIGMVNEWGDEEAVALLTNVGENLGTFQAAGWVALAAAVLTGPATVVLWRLAVRRSSRWAWAGAILGACSVAGQFVHLMGYFALTQVFAQQEDLVVPGHILVEADRNALALALFVPYLLGTLLALPVLAIALRRARVIPPWALGSVLAGGAAMMVLGSHPVVSTVWAVTVGAGLAPAAAAWVRDGLEAEPSLPLAPAHA